MSEWMESEIWNPGVLTKGLHKLLPDFVRTSLEFLFLSAPISVPKYPCFGDIPFLIPPRQYLIKVRKRTCQIMNILVQERPTPVIRV